MANHEHLKLLKQGSIVWNKWKKQHPKALPNLSGANLSGANLTNVDLSSANLMGADLRNTDLSEANLHEANLWCANLSRANLSRANLSGANLNEAELNDANLVGANLSNADLGYASLSRTDLNRVNLSRAITWMTTFADVDLSTAIGLTTVVHKGPSTIGIDTIYRSQGVIPERFLREAGVPDTLLDTVHSLTSQSVPYFTCFISHSRRDQHFCDRLYSDLQAMGVKAWYFPADATWGKSVWGEIDSSIKVYDKLVVVCSKYSLQSGPVIREIERALQREDREKKHILFPLRLDNYLFDKWEHERKADVLSKVVGDFRGWSHDDKKYEVAFQKFLKALKASE